MKSCIPFLLVTSCAPLALAQSASAPATTQPSATVAAVKPDPDAFAAKDPNKVVATINGQDVTAKEADDLLKFYPEDQRRNVPNLQNTIQQIYLARDLAQKAIAQKLDQQSPYREKIEFAKDSALAQAYVADLEKKTAPTSDPKQYYDAHPQEFDRADVSGIAISFNPPGTPASSASSNRTEADAQQKADDIEKRLKTGADFVAEARANSDEAQSAARGGSLGTIPASAPNLPPDLRDVIFNKLQPGQISEPIKLGNAYYIVKVTSRNRLPYEQAKASIEQQLKAEHDRAVVKEVTDKYKLQVVDPTFFGTSASAAKIPSLAQPGTHTQIGSGSSPATPVQQPAPPK